MARFGLLAALSLVLGYIDRATPLTWILGGTIPGIKLGLANTVLLYAVYLMDWRGCVLLMLTKVLLSGFMFGSMSAIIYSLSGGVLSLIVMLAVKRKPALGAFVIGLMALAADGYLLYQHPSPKGQMFWCILLIGLAVAASFAIAVVIRKKPEYRLMGVSLAGAVFHNVGQCLAASFIVRTPQLLYSYLPVLAGIGAVVGCLTGFVAKLVMKAIRSPGF